MLPGSIENGLILSRGFRGRTVDDDEAVDHMSRWNNVGKISSVEKKQRSMNVGLGTKERVQKTGDSEVVKDEDGLRNTRLNTTRTTSKIVLGWDLYWW
jgi:hypothetical protein